MVGGLVLLVAIMNDAYKLESELTIKLIVEY